MRTYGLVVLVLLGSGVVSSLYSSWNDPLMRRSSAAGAGLSPTFMWKHVGARGDVERLQAAAAGLQGGARGEDADAAGDGRPRGRAGRQPGQPGQPLPRAP